MARRTTNTDIIPAFSTNDKVLYGQLNQTIESAQASADGLARTIAGALHRVREKELFKIDGFKNIYEYSEQKHGISRGATSDAINVYKAFADPNNKGQLLPEWDAFGWRALIMMKNYDKKELKALGMSPDMKSAEISQRIQDYKKVQPLLELPENKDWNWETVKRLVSEREAIATSGEEIKEEKASTESSTVEPETPVTRDTTNEEIPADTARHTDEQILEMAKNVMGEDAYNDFVTREGDDIVDAAKDYLDEFQTFPKKVLEVTATTSQKEILDYVKSHLEGLRAGEYDIIITLVNN